MTREEMDAVERGPTAEELAEEIRCFELWQCAQEQETRERRQHTARWHRHLSSETAA